MALLLLIEGVKADVLAAFKPNRCTAAASHSRLSGAVVTQLFTIFLVVMPQTGCVHQPVNGLVKPTHFEFVTITPQRKRGPGGWRAACIQAQIKHGNSGESYICNFGVEMPIENEKNGPISDYRRTGNCSPVRQQCRIYRACRHDGANSAAAIYVVLRHQKQIPRAAV